MSSESLITLAIIKSVMRKFIALVRALFEGKATIDSVDKTLVSRTPGDVTDLTHN
jgi:hypothetical protein